MSDPEAPVARLRRPEPHAPGDVRPTPRARPTVAADRTQVLGTGGMLRHARSCTAPVDVIGTEVGLLHPSRKEAPGRTFVPLREDAVCEYMKLSTLPKLYRPLRDDVYEVPVEPTIAARARSAVDRMIAVTSG